MQRNRIQQHQEHQRQQRACVPQIELRGKLSEAVREICRFPCRTEPETEAHPRRDLQPVPEAEQRQDQRCLYACGQEHLLCVCHGKRRITAEKNAHPQQNQYRGCLHGAPVLLRLHRSASLHHQRIGLPESGGLYAGFA